MKLINYTYTLSFIIIIGLAAAACEGPAGPQGTQGEQGTQGPPGPQGEPGNANVMYSEWMNIEWFEGSDEINKEMIIHESRITSRFLDDGGTVLMFMKAEGDAGILVYPLPWTTSGGMFYFGFILADLPDALEGEGFQGIIFLLRSLDGETSIADELWNTLQIRYILVPGSMNLAAKGFDLFDYAEVSDYFGISN